MKNGGLKEMNTQSAATYDIPIEVTIKAEVGISARVARRIVNVELIKKVGDLIMTGTPELFMDGKKLYWKVPFLAVPPDDDANTYPTGQSALVDAHSGLYVLEEEDIVCLKTAARPILTQLYPDLEEYIRKAREGYEND
jgi:hypothetical protein